uniref:SUEL-type lectin domain-containing protein n=1 Tax=Echeneis naucrates TaxID=173247 RepID=A0A665TL21_ECHNA
MVSVRSRGAETSHAQMSSGIGMTSFSTQRTIACDGSDNVQRLSCEDGLISVQEALYGRKDREICSEDRPAYQLTNTDCSQVGTLDVIKRRCDGKKVCEFNTQILHTSDPCFGTFKYLDTTYNCVHGIHSITCEHSLAILKCDQGLVIHVQSANYGRHDQTTCSFNRPPPQLQNVRCSHPINKVAESCNGKNSCIIKASNSVFGDPCYGTFKYLEVSYTCDCK